MNDVIQAFFPQPQCLSVKVCLLKPGQSNTHTSLQQTQSSQTKVVQALLHPKPRKTQAKYTYLPQHVLYIHTHNNSGLPQIRSTRCVMTTSSPKLLTKSLVSSRKVRDCPRHRRQLRAVYRSIYRKQIFVQRPAAEIGPVVG